MTGWLTERMTISSAGIVLQPFLGNDMSRILELTLLGLPKRMNQSLRGGWHSKYAEAKKWKRMIAIACLGRWTGAPLEKAKLTLTRFSSVEPDYDGIVSSFKHLIDGLVECGVLANDKLSNVGSPTYLWEKAKPKEGRVRMKIEEIVDGC